MQRALIIGASGGIGAAIADEIAKRSWQVACLSRSVDGLDVTSEASIEQTLSAVDGPFDLIVVATGALTPSGHAPEKAIRDINGEALLAQFQINAIGPALILKHSLRLLPNDRRSVFATLSARVGSIGDNKLGGWHGYRASKAALNQFIHGASIELRRTHKQAIAICLHPGTVATAFTEAYSARHSAVSPQAAAVRLVDVVEGLETTDSGGFIDYGGNKIPW